MSPGSCNEKVVDAKVQRGRGEYWKNAGPSLWHSAAWPPRVWLPSAATTPHSNKGDLRLDASTTPLPPLSLIPASNNGGFGWAVLRSQTKVMPLSSLCTELALTEGGSSFPSRRAAPQAGEELAKQEPKRGTHATLGGRDCAGRRERAPCAQPCAPPPASIPLEVSHVLCVLVWDGRLFLLGAAGWWNWRFKSRLLPPLLPSLLGNPIGSRNRGGTQSLHLLFRWKSPPPSSGDAWLAHTPKPHWCVWEFEEPTAPPTHTHTPFSFSVSEEMRVYGSDSWPFLPRLQLAHYTHLLKSCAE